MQDANDVSLEKKQSKLEGLNQVYINEAELQEGVGYEPILVGNVTDQVMPVDIFVDRANLMAKYISSDDPFVLLEKGGLRNAIIAATRIPSQRAAFPLSDSVAADASLLEVTCNSSKKFELYKETDAMTMSGDDAIDQLLYRIYNRQLVTHGDLINNFKDHSFEALKKYIPKAVLLNKMVDRDKFMIELSNQCAKVKAHPLELLYIFAHESSFNPGSISKDGEYCGLNQMHRPNFAKMSVTFEEYAALSGADQLPHIFTFLKSRFPIKDTANIFHLSVANWLPAIAKLDAKGDQVVAMLSVSKFYSNFDPANTGILTNYNLHYYKAAEAITVSNIPEDFLFANKPAPTAKELSDFRDKVKCGESKITIAPTVSSKFKGTAKPKVNSAFHAINDAILVAFLNEQIGQENVNRLLTTIKATVIVASKRTDWSALKSEDVLSGLLMDEAIKKNTFDVLIGVNPQFAIPFVAVMNFIYSLGRKELMFYPIEGRRTPETQMKYYTSKPPTTKTLLSNHLLCMAIDVIHVTDHWNAPALNFKIFGACFQLIGFHSMACDVSPWDLPHIEYVTVKSKKELFSAGGWNLNEDGTATVSKKQTLPAELKLPGFWSLDVNMNLAAL